MKIRLIHISFVILLIGFTSSCTKDDENNTTVNNGDPRSAFIGTWVCDEQSEVFGNNTYSVDINPHSSISNRIVVDNFYNLGFQQSNCQMEVSGNSVNIFLQDVNGFQVQGSATLINNSQINLSYVADDGSGPDNVTAVYTKTN